MLLENIREEGSAVARDLYYDWTYFKASNHPSH